MGDIEELWKKLEATNPRTVRRFPTNLSSEIIFEDNYVPNPEEENAENSAFEFIEQPSDYSFETNDQNGQSGSNPFDTDNLIGQPGSNPFETDDMIGSEDDYYDDPFEDDEAVENVGKFDLIKDGGTVTREFSLSQYDVDVKQFQPFRNKNPRTEKGEDNTDKQNVQTDGSMRLKVKFSPREIIRQSSDAGSAKIVCDCEDCINQTDVAECQCEHCSQSRDVIINPEYSEDQREITCYCEECLNHWEEVDYVCKCEQCQFDRQCLFKHSSQSEMPCHCPDCVKDLVVIHTENGACDCESCKQSELPKNRLSHDLSAVRDLEKSGYSGHGLPQSDRSIEFITLRNSSLEKSFDSKGSNSPRSIRSGSSRNSGIQQNRQADIQLHNSELLNGDHVHEYINSLDIGQMKIGSDETYQNLDKVGPNGVQIGSQVGNKNSDGSSAGIKNKSDSSDKSKHVAHKVFDHIVDHNSSNKKGFEMSVKDDYANLLCMRENLNEANEEGAHSHGGESVHSREDSLVEEDRACLCDDCTSSLPPSHKFNSQSYHTDITGLLEQQLQNTEKELNAKTSEYKKEITDLKKENEKQNQLIQKLEIHLSPNSYGQTIRTKTTSISTKPHAYNAKKRRQERSLSLTSEAKIDATMQHEITRLTSENLDLSELVDQQAEQIRKLKKMLKVYAKRLKEGEAAEIQAELEREETKSVENVAQVKHRERNYMGMLEYKKEDETALLKALILELKPKVASGLLPGLPAYVLFMCVRHTDYVNDDEKVRSFLTSTINGIKKVVKKHHDDLDRVTLWLANTCRFLHTLKQYSGEKQFQQENTPRQNEHCLRNFDLAEYRQVFSDLAVWIYQTLIKLMEATIQPSIGMFWMNQFVRVLTQHAVDPELVKQIFRQVYYFLGASALNNLLLRKEILEPIVQASQLLQARKTDADVDSVCDMCSKLTVPQIDSIFKMKQDISPLLCPVDEFEERVPISFIRKIQQKLKERVNTDNSLLMDLKFSYSVTFPFTPSKIILETIEVPEQLHINKLVSRWACHLK
ncbi:MYO5A-like protein [Mya arenaria]|uniref:MYO5A-like protein n=1 Tax=Mya arenaria TaxID=6604 RepID=A0ABY7G6J0_MYAAR|nr:MYO5A-like protein [Mya arenaria]